MLTSLSLRTTQEIYTHRTPDAEKWSQEMDEMFRPVSGQIGQEKLN